MVLIALWRPLPHAELQTRPGEQDAEHAADAPFSIEVVESEGILPLEFTATDPPREGRGPSQRIAWRADFRGTLHVWTKAAELDLSLNVEDVSGTLVGQDDNSGGGTAPYLALEVTPGLELAIDVSCAPSSANGTAELHLVAAPESDRALVAVEPTERELAAIEELRARGAFDEARERIRRLADGLLEIGATDGCGSSAALERLLWSCGAKAYALGEVEVARNARAPSLRERERTLPNDHMELNRARLSFALMIKGLGDLPGALALEQQVLEIRTRTLPDDHPELSKTRLNLATTIASLGDLQGARALLEKVLEVHTRTLPDDHADLQKTRMNFSNTLYALGDLSGARALLEKVLEVYSRTLPDDHLDLQMARAQLALTLSALGDLGGTRTLQEKVLDVETRTLPDDHPELQKARLNLAATLHTIGEVQDARALQEKALEVWTRTLPDDHPDLQAARQHFAVILKTLGDLQGARALEEKALQVWTRTLPNDHPNLQDVRASLAYTIHKLGDLQGARALRERVLDACTNTLPDDHPDLQAARRDVASTMKALGDLHGACALEEMVLEVQTRTLPNDHPDLQATRLSLAHTLVELGDLHGGRVLEESVLEVFTRMLPSEHRDLQVVRLNLAATLVLLGDLQVARALFAQVLEIFTSTLPGEHPDLQMARRNLGLTLDALGDSSGALALFEEVLEVQSRTLPNDHPDLQTARSNMLWARIARGEREEALRLALDIATAFRDGLMSGLAVFSPREVEDRAAASSLELSDVLSVGAGPGNLEPSPDLARDGFAVVESARAAGLWSAALASTLGSSAERDRSREVESRLAGELARLAQGGGSRDELAAVRRELDRERRSRLDTIATDARCAPLLVQPTVDALSSRLEPGQALVGFWRYTRKTVDRDDPSLQYHSEALLAYVVRPGGTLARVELGPVSAVEDRAAAWLSAQAGLGDARASRGLQSDTSQASLGALKTGSALRELVFDPLLAALGDAHHVIVALDDVLHLVPLEALPVAALDGSDSILGEAYRIETRVALRELLWPERSTVAGGEVVLLGGCDYGADPMANDRPEPARPQNEVIAAAFGGGSAPALLRSTMWEQGFAELPYTESEVLGIANVRGAEQDLERAPIVLRGTRASREALEELAPRARILHLATHGWFAPESVSSTEDPAPLEMRSGVVFPMTRMTRAAQVHGSSPMVLCGLALAGANLAPNEQGRVRGLITAEEIASFDLSQCELAVLSACDTNVGVRRAGQGVASLQKALHMAGARSVITSLWKVPDEATKELMVDFYRRLWVEKKPKHQALWEAKMRLRNTVDEQGRPLYATRDWAAWVLTGNPD